MSTRDENLGSAVGRIYKEHRDWTFDQITKAALREVDEGKGRTAHGATGTEPSRGNRLREARLAIASSNLTLSPREVEARARAYVRDEEIAEELAQLQAEMDLAEAEHEKQRAARRDLLSSGGDSGGPSSREMLKELETMVERGEGW